jgi:glycosyltransferase A (GT-A) superfamily protein (DUF2064 family)
MIADTLAIIAKQPLPGKVKTRLIGAISPAGVVSPIRAAALAGAALRDTVACLSQLDCRRRLLVLDGERPGWLPADWLTIAQKAGGLDERLSAGFDAFGGGSALLVGMDTPQLTAAQLECDLLGYDACLGLADDGGYWAIGFADARRARALIQGVPMSRPDTGAWQLDRLYRAGLRVQLLPTMTDVDTGQSAADVALADPSTEFAQLWQGHSLLDATAAAVPG